MKPTMKSMIKSTIIVFFLFLIAIVFLGLGFFFWKAKDSDPTALPSVLINKPIPNFQVSTLASSKKTLSPKNFGHKVVLVNFWASWCLVCSTEHEVLGDISKIIPVYGIVYKDSQSAAQHWLNQHGNIYTTIGLDPTGDIGISFGLYGVPESYLIDKNNIIRYKVVGQITNKIFQHTLLPLIRKYQAEK